MANYAGNGVTHTFLADVDLSNYQYYLMAAASTAGKVTPSITAGGSIIGVLQNDPVAGEEATIVVLGPTKVRVTAEATASPLSFGGWVKSSSTGQATGFVSATASTWAAGWYMDTAFTSGSGVYAEMFVLPERIV